MVAEEHKIRTAHEIVAQLHRDSQSLESLLAVVEFRLGTVESDNIDELTAITEDAHEVRRTLEAMLQRVRHVPGGKVAA